MYKRTKILATLTAAAVLAMGGAAFARPGGHHGFGGGPHRLLKLAEKLDLTDAQKTMLEEMRAEAKKSWKDKHAKMQETRLAIAEEIEKPVIDQTKLAALSEQHMEVMRQNMQARIRDFAKFHQTLTPKQKQELASRLREMKRPEGKGHGKKHGRE